MKTVHAHVGQTILYYAPDGDAIGQDAVPAMITRVWSQECVNLELLTGGFKGLAFQSITNDRVDGECLGPCWRNVDGDCSEELEKVFNAEVFDLGMSEGDGASGE